MRRKVKSTIFEQSIGVVGDLAVVEGSLLFALVARAIAEVDYTYDDDDGDKSCALCPAHRVDKMRPDSTARSRDFWRQV